MTKKDILHQFEKAFSTFTWIGRHAAEIGFLYRTLPTEPANIFNISKSGLETHVLAHLASDNSKVYAVGINPTILALLQNLTDGKEFDVPTELNGLLCNKYPDGNLRENSDFTNEELFNKGLEELNRGGINPDEFLNGKLFHASEKSKNRITVVDQPLEIYLASSQLQFDFVYMSLVLQNLSKVSDRKDVIALVKQIRDSLTPKGVIGIGSNPFGLYGEDGAAAILEEGEFAVTDILADHFNFLKSGSTGKDGFFGGYCLRGVKDSNNDQYSLITTETIDQTIARDQYLSQVTMIYHELKEDQLKDYLLEQNQKLMVAALRRCGKYDLWESPTDELSTLIGKERHLFNLTPTLRYS